MKIPLPCKLGETALCKGKMLTLVSVDWFKWTQGIEYTYFFGTNNFWHNVDFYTTFQNEQPHYFEIPDELMNDGPIIDKGYPLRGSGRAFGIDYLEGRTYIEFIMTSNYFSHIKVQCDDRGMYYPQGDIIFPHTPSFESDENKERFIAKSIVKKTNLKTDIKQDIKQEPCRQLTLFELM
jgi:hypothetical protein